MSEHKPTTYSPNRYPKRRNHPFIISGIFDILIKLEADNNNQYGNRTYQTTISTLSQESADIVEWVINATAYPAKCYYLKGRLLAFNTKATQNFYFEPDHHVFVNTSDALPGGLANTISATGVGLIISRSVETQESFEVQYRCNWSKMEKLQILLVPNREVVITGNVTGWIPSSHTWVVDLRLVLWLIFLPRQSLSPHELYSRSLASTAFTGAPNGASDSAPAELELSPPSSPNGSPSKANRRMASKSKTNPSPPIDLSPENLSTKGKARALPKSPSLRAPAKRSKVFPEEAVISDKETEAQAP
ncbi:hypothetical protein DFH28DRAFT_1077345 [Melampsora americana]|nr:hypothetical protein DFH28DRAFT_1077345 [Melampsora americana]